MACFDLIITQDDATAITNVLEAPTFNRRRVVRQM